MNLLEKTSIAAIIVLSTSIVFILFTSSKNTGSIEQAEKELSSLISDSTLIKRMAAEKHLTSGRKYKKSEEFIEAIDEYYKAGKLHPDYMDASSKDFLGDELKEVIKFSIVKLNQKLKMNPDDKNIISRLKIIYKMEKRFGQGCE
ncbi:hypothetical protein HY745_03105 [Candidatus Desantisbacteria bacterium]|nr:hypothetical protein [Candidatus Desantisbacteria bacterium]